MEPQALSGGESAAAVMLRIRSRGKHRIVPPGYGSELLPWAPVQFVGSSEDILVGVLFKRCPLGDESPKQAVVALVLETLPGCVGMSEEGFGSPLLHLGKVSKLASVVHRNGLKDLGEVFAILVMELKYDFNIISSVFNHSQQRHGYWRIKVMLKKGESQKSEPPYYDGMPVAWNISCTPDARLVNIMLDRAISILPTDMHPVVH